MSTRDYIIVYINGTRHEISGKQALIKLSDYLRYDLQKVGTKVVCEEGDCGACTVLIGKRTSSKEELTRYRAINSCIAYMWSLDGASIITVEGLKEGESLHPMQQSMIDNFGAQCGFCTPGFVCSMAQLADDIVLDKKSTKVNQKKAQNYLTGNLCRCTGYLPILDAATKANLENYTPLAKRYNSEKIQNSLNISDNVEIKYDGLSIFIPSNKKDLLSYLDNNKDAKITSGGSDFSVLLNKRKASFDKVVSLNNIMDLYQFEEQDGFLNIGSKVNYTQLEKITEKSFPEFSKLLHVFASPQIKNVGTMVGNIVNASPIGDTLPFLLVSGGRLNIEAHKSKRKIEINDFFQGYKKFDLNPGEIISSVEIPKKDLDFKLYKISVRKDLDIAAVTFAASYKVKNNKITHFNLALGGVAEKPKRIFEIEDDLVGKDFSKENFEKASEKIITLINPLSDVRGESSYRKLICQNLLKKFFFEVSKEVVA